MKAASIHLYNVIICKSISAEIFETSSLEHVLK